MGGLCSKRSAVDMSPSESTLDANNVRDHEAVPYESRLKMESNSTAEPNFGENKEKWLPHPPLSFSDRMMPTLGSVSSDAADDRERQLSRSLSEKSRSTSSKVGTTKVRLYC